MKKLLFILLLAVSPLVGNAQPGSVGTAIEHAIGEAVENARFNGGHLYAKCDIQHRWLETWLEGHPVVTVVAIDEGKKWYQFWRKEGVHGFWFDLKTGSDLGLTSYLDKNLLHAMRRALLSPRRRAVGQTGDSVTYCQVDHASYDPDRFDRWMNSQRDIPITWTSRNTDGTLSLTFVTLEQQEAFVRKNNQTELQQSLRDARRPLAAYAVDFEWFNKSNFLIECDGIIFLDSLFATASEPGTVTTLVKRYDKLLVWENGFYLGTSPLMQLPQLTVLWKEISKLQSSPNSQVNIRSIRSLPFDEKYHRNILAQYEDSLYSRHCQALKSTGSPDRKLLENYFRIYGKYGTAHTNDIERTIFDMARRSMDWGAYYLQTYNARQGRWHDSIDDISFQIVLSDFSQATTYRNLFPMGRHLDEADEIITFQKACRLYDAEIYLSKYPSGRYRERFQQYMDKEEQRLYREANEIYEFDNAPDIESTLLNAVSPYLRHFPKGPHLREINEMYHYGTAVQRRNAIHYSSYHSLRSPHGKRLAIILANPLPEGISYPKKSSIAIHSRILAIPVSQYIDYQRLSDGSFLVTAIHLELDPCHYNHPYSLNVKYDSSTGTFFIPLGNERKYQSNTLFQTIKLQLLEGYDSQSGTLYDIEQWFLDNCRHLSLNR